MRVLVTKGPNAGLVLDMGTRQAQGAIEGGWAELPPDSPTVVPSFDATAEVNVTDPVETGTVFDGVDGLPRNRRGKR